MSDLCLIDLSGVYWEKWHAAAGSDANAAFDWTMDRVRELSAGHARSVVCIDAGHDHRAAIHPGYKANRPPKPEAAVAQLARVVRALEAEGHTCARSPGYEADDVIGALTALATAKGLSVTVASADKDMLQLVGPGVTVVSTKTGAAYVTEADVVQKIGVRPYQVADWLALAGDTTDGIPGAPGVGGKTAAAILAAHGSLDGMVGPLADSESSGQLAGATPRIAAILREHWDQVLMCRKLTGLATDCPIDAELLNRPGKVDMDTTTEAEIEHAEELQRKDDDERAELAVRAATDLAEPPAPAAAQREWALSEGPTTNAQAWKLAQVLSASGMFKAFRGPESTFVAILAGHDMGLTPLTALRGIHVIEGKPTISADLMASIILASGKAKFFRCVLAESNAQKATYETHRDGDPEPVRHVFTMDDAKAAELAGKGMWKKYPRNMLRARCISELARMVYPDLLAGVYTAEELER